MPGRIGGVGHEAAERYGGVSRDIAFLYGGVYQDIEVAEGVVLDFGGGEDVTTMMRDVQEHGGQVIELVFGMPLSAPHHNDYFDVDEEVIPLAIRIFTQLALTAGDWTK